MRRFGRLAIVLGVSACLAVPTAAAAGISSGSSDSLSNNESSSGAQGRSVEGEGPDIGTVASHILSTDSSVPTVVLGARLNPDCSSPDVLTRRVNRTASFLLLHPDNPVVVTGGKTQRGCDSEAQAMELALRNAGVRNQIIREDSAGSTKENAQKVAELLPNNHVMVLVSDASHLPRATQNFAEVGIVSFGVPVS